MGMHGQGQAEARAFRAGPIRTRKRSEALSNLYVIVRLTKAANGKERVVGEFPPTGRLGTSTPVAARIFFICCSTMDKFAAGLGQSVPFI